MTKRPLLAVLIASAVVGIPLYLKSRAPTVRPLQPDRGSALAPTAESLPRLVDFGTTTCAPCKAMLAVMAELEQKYPGAMVIEFVNVQERPAEAQRYGVQVIPSQIFYAPDGKELYRHTGVFRTDAILAKWEELGFRFPAPREKDK